VSGLLLSAIGVFLLVVGVNSWDRLPSELAGLIALAPSRISLVLIASGFFASVGGLVLSFRRPAPAPQSIHEKHHSP
jgi:hypothetical protein